MAAREVFVATALAAAVALAAGCRREDGPPPPAHEEGAKDVISETRAIELARAACAGKAEIPAGVRPRVSLADGKYVVVFPADLPPGTRGADYHAKVTLDAKTGAVIEVLGGS